ncbi:MAG: hypothetical protein COZ80_08235 [Ignavibacteria bacterium CG_4_8_14_3_um_filter_37_9]|nr:hypothetical protein [Ignavibacteria bacterium]OIO14515.1 MAG: hypothetical protein AUJ54_14165 [Ignavibacteria bacterium CG1_02_37_35]PIP76350.1 MAG: hypothetical protein COW85_14665 [Ignavibacteria bacterium CG22_combo_CG10-13_8_21_14_all_37_15]PIS45726.1 MAG: hypothetical protein COT22_03740 [Ignavibacteria bacterium CG08_land_8_20_14_0_20_37_9]PIW98890.1 MAG: hypothetical protein COZ80_08235 [Ignavibacteria bacterium CG_4_8_14_3_um_filter_37_9]PIX93472.1 MAG: hypothetical protein COZ25_
MKQQTNTRFSYSKFLIFAILSLWLAGCINYEQEVSFSPDGSGDMKIHYWIKADTSGGKTFYDPLGIFNADSLRADFSSPNIKIENINVSNDTTDSTAHAVIALTFTHIDSLNKVKPFAEYHFSMQDGAAGQKIFSQFIPPIATGFGLNDSTYRVTYIYTFPGEIVTHNAIKVEKKKLIWTYSLADIGKGKTISVSFRPFKLKETPYWIFFLAGFVLAVVVFFLFRKKRTW